LVDYGITFIILLPSVENKSENLTVWIVESKSPKDRTLYS